jgi:CRP/FNR family transcriptional regulator, cyclic AMP receptor protein
VFPLTIDALRRTTLFASLADDDLRELVLRVRHLRYGREHVVFHEGDPAGGLYIVAKGEVRITLPALAGEDVVPILVGPGDAFGELGILDDQPRSATATTTMDSELLLLSREDFRTVLRARPSVMFDVLRALASMVRHADERLREDLLSVNTRLARRLLELADRHGEQRSDGVVIRRLTTDTELAGLTGLHRMEVDRLLEHYQYNDIVRWDQGYLVLRRPEVLATWARGC